MIARPITAVTTLTNEPEPQHDRPTSTPSAPARPRHYARTARTLRATTPAEIQREEDASGRDGTGYQDEPEDRFSPIAPLLGDKALLDYRLHQLVRDLVADGDQRAARAGRRAPRTLDAMRYRMASTPPPARPELPVRKPGDTIPPLVRRTARAADVARIGTGNA